MRYTHSSVHLVFSGTAGMATRGNPRGGLRLLAQFACGVGDFARVFIPFHQLATANWCSQDSSGPRHFG